MVLKYGGELETINFCARRVSRFRNPPSGEQQLVRQFFNKKNGFFVDVGANHPTLESQTWHLEQLGWNGLLIEPLDEYCEMLRKERRARTIQVACSNPKNHGQQLRMTVAAGHSTLNANPIALGTHSKQFETVECRTLDSVLQDNDVQTIDMMSIDIEGHEMEMFAGFSLMRWKPRLVLLEDHVTTHEKHRHMVSSGYQLIFRTGLNSWYVPVEEGFSLSGIANFQKFRKYWLGLPGRKIKYRR